MIASLWLALAVAQAGDLGGDYRGTLGRKIVMRLSADGAQLRGSYFYEPHIDDITLAGEVDADGSFTLQESPLAGKPSGHFSGKRQSDGSLAGRWKGTADGKELAFNLAKLVPDPSGRAPATLVVRKVKIDRGKCSFQASYPELVGAATPEVEAKINSALRPSAFEGDEKLPAQLGDAKAVCAVLQEGSHEESTEVHQNGAGVLSFLTTVSDYSGGAYPNNGLATRNYALPSGRKLTVADVLKKRWHSVPRGSKTLRVEDPEVSEALRQALAPLITAALKEAQVDDDSDLRAKVEEALLQPDVDFVLERKGLRLFAFNALPHAVQAVGADGFLLRWSALRGALREDSPASRLWKP